MPIDVLLADLTEKKKKQYINVLRYAQNRKIGKPISLGAIIPKALT